MTGIPDWLTKGLLVARVRLVRQVRSSREQPWIAFFQAFAVLFGVVLAVGVLPLPGYGSVWTTPGGYVFGQRVAAGESAAVLSTVRGFGGVVFVLLVFLTVLKEATDGAMDTNADALLVATDVRTVATGEVCWSLAFTGWQFGVPLLAGAVAFGVGARSVLAGLGVAVAGAALVVTAVPIGYVASLLVRIGFQTLPVLRENKLLVGAPLAVLYFGLFVQARRSIELLAGIPLGWYGDLALAPAAAVDPTHAAGALAVAPVVAVGATALAARLGTRSWYGDPPRERTVTEQRTPGPMDRLLDAVAARPTAAVARTAWTRIARQPKVLMFTAMPIALTASVGVEVVSHRPTALPVVVAVYGAAAVGMGLTLNPLGNVGAGLPATLTTPGGGRAIVRGYVVSAALPGIPLVVALSVATGALVALDPATLLAVAAVGGLLATAAATISMGIGVKLPNYDSLRATSESGVRPPRLLATTAFLVVMALVGTPALVGIGWGPVVGSGLGIGAVGAVVLGMATTATLAVAASLVAYRSTCSAIANYRVE